MSLRKRSVIICDIDNVLSHDAWRRRLIIPVELSVHRHDWARYHAYHLASAMDEANFIPEMASDMRSRYEIYFFTAMPEAYRRVRASWFIKNGKRPSPDHIYMRANDDTRSSVDVKRDMFRRLETKVDRCHISAAYDDRLDILEMYATEFGIKTIHRSLHEQGHYDN